MEEISFRTSMTILAGVVALAAVIAVAGILLSRSPATARPSALGRAPGPRPAAVAPTSAQATPTRTASPTSSPSRSSAHRTSSQAGDTSQTGIGAAAEGPDTGQPAMPGTAAPSTSSGGRPATTPKASRTWPSRSQIAAWWAWWSQHRGQSGGHSRYPGGGSGPRWGRGGY